MNFYKDVSSRTLLTVTLAGVVLFLAFFFYFNQKKQVQSDSVSPSIANTAVVDEQKEMGSGLPVRLKIAKINVDAAIEPMGIAPSGDMEVPSEPGKAGWYKSGPYPGDSGNAIIDGHFGRWKNGEGSVFDNLSNLEKGDVIYVEDEKGAEISFVVRESRRYDPDADASDVFESNDGKPHLNLITCEGTWDKISKSYSGRLVVFADKETNTMP